MEQNWSARLRQGDEDALCEIIRQRTGYVSTILRNFSRSTLPPEDLEELVQLFYETVHTVNLGDYTRRETDVWAPSPAAMDRAAWGESLSAHDTVVAEREGQLLCFGDMDATGYFDRLYVHREFQGRGAASAIAEALEGYALGLGLGRVTVHASRTARPFFQRRGYKTLYAQQVERRGVWLTNYVMGKK